MKNSSILEWVSLSFFAVLLSRVTSASSVMLSHFYSALLSHITKGFRREDEPEAPKSRSKQQAYCIKLLNHRVTQLLRRAGEPSRPRLSYCATSLIPPQRSFPSRPYNFARSGDLKSYNNQYRAPSLKDVSANNATMEEARDDQAAPPMKSRCITTRHAVQQWQQHYSSSGKHKSAGKLPLEVSVEMIRDKAQIQC